MKKILEKLNHKLINNKSYTFITLIIIVLIIFSYLKSEQTPFYPPNFAQEYMSNIKVTRFNQSGTIQDAVFAKYWAFMPKEHKSVIKNPSINLITKNGDIWKIKANNGVAFHESLESKIDNIELTDNVTSTNKTQNINIESNNMLLDNKNKTITYKGNVITTKENSKLNSENLTLYKDNKSDSIDKIISTGEPTIFEVKKNNKIPFYGQAKKIEYYPSLDKIVLINSASLDQGANHITGDYLTYNIQQESLESNNFDNSTKRTKVIINPKSKN